MRIVWRIVWRIVVVVGALTFLSSGVQLLGKAHGKCSHVEVGRRYVMLVNTCFDDAKWSSAKAVGNTGWAMSGAAAGWLSITVGVLGLGVVAAGLADLALHRSRGRHRGGGTAPRQDAPEAAFTVAIEAGQDLAARIASSLDRALPTAVQHAAILLGTMIEVGTDLVRTHPSGILADSRLAKLAAFAEENGLPGERIARLIRERSVAEAVAVSSAALLRVAALHGLALPDEVAMQLPLWMVASHQ